MASSVLSAPHIVPLMIEVSLPNGLTAPHFTRFDGGSACSPTNRERPAYSGNFSTCTNPATDIRLCSSNTAESTVKYIMGVPKMLAEL